MNAKQEKNFANRTYEEWLGLAQREPSGVCREAWKNSEDPLHYRARGNVRNDRCTCCGFYNCIK